MLKTWGRQEEMKDGREDGGALNIFMHTMGGLNWHIQLLG